MWQWARASVGLLWLLPSHASALTLDWAVVNNFALLKGSETQERFEREVETFATCIRRTGDVTACSENQRADGLTQRPYPVRFDPRTARYTSDLLHPGSRPGVDRFEQSDQLSVRLTVSGAPEGTRCHWTVDGHLHTGRPCASATVSVGIDTAATVRVAIESDLERSVETTVLVRRRVILAMGDSFMSGEGNPHRRRTVFPVRSELWLEERCHRSLLAASALAAVRFADANPKIYVAYLNFACSGSTVTTGLLGSYGGVLSARLLAATRGIDDARAYFRGERLPSQIEQAKSALCRGTGRARTCLTPDLIWLGIGVNDVGFRQIVTALAGSTCDARCRARLELRVAPAMARLTGAGPGSLARTLETIERELRPRRAMTVGYPDPTRADSGDFCDASILGSSIGGLGRIDASENKWAFERVVTPLNAALADVVRGRERWTFLEGAVAATTKHGYCARIPHFNSGLDSNVEAGTMHPNALGHAIISRLMFDAMRDLAGE